MLLLRVYKYTLGLSETKNRLSKPIRFMHQLAEDHAVVGCPTTPFIDSSGSHTNQPVY